MSHLPTLISDLALILIVAGVSTLIFKRLKQPLVLGYIVAGMMVGPAITFLPSIQDSSNIQVWADIGVLFLLFALGLEFSFKKLISVGKTGIITAMVEVVSLLVIGYLIGRLLGWGNMNSLFLGGMLSMSSTTIIIKAFDDMNLRRKKFASLVFGVLVVEDLVAIVMMVLLSTIAVSSDFSGWSLLASILKLVFFLSIWFIFGIYLIPSFLKSTRRLMNDETLLVVSVGLCLCMVVLAVKVGFSSALGAFIMGSILAETLEVERIEHLIKPLKDLFGAIFFVSVGMMVNLSVIVNYVWPILVITLVVLVFKLLATSFGMMLSGQSLKISLQSGFSLAQIGEFAFIIAALGMNLGVISDFLYPVAVTVSVVTTFLTPYMIRLSGPCVYWLSRSMPDSWKRWLASRRGNEVFEGSKQLQDWMSLLKYYTLNYLLMLMLNVAILMLSRKFLEPFLHEQLPEGPWASLIAAFATLVVMSPFIRSLMSNRSKTAGYMMNLWIEGKQNRIVIRMLMILRLLSGFCLIVYVLLHFLSLPAIWVVPVALGLMWVILRSRRLMRYYWNIESRFMINLNERQMEKNRQKIISNRGVRDSQDMGEAHWLDRRLYAFSMKVGESSVLVGKSLRELSFRSHYELMLIRVERASAIVNIPDSQFVLQAGDVVCFAGRNLVMTLLGNDSFALSFVPDSLMTLHHFSQQEAQRSHHALCCTGIPIHSDSQIAGQTLMESQIGRKHKCLVIGLERKNQQYVNPSSKEQLAEGDLVWVLGEESFVSKLVAENVFGI